MQTLTLSYKYLFYILNEFSLPVLPYLSCLFTQGYHTASIICSGVYRWTACASPSVDSNSRYYTHTVKCSAEEGLYL